MRKLGSEAKLAATLFAASAALAAITPGQVTGEPGRIVGSGTLPVSLALVLSGLSLLLLVGAMRRPLRDLSQASPFWPVLIFVGGMALYIAVLPVAGFALATALLIVGLCLLFGERRWFAIAALAVVVPLALLLFFERFMIILLPGGLWN